MKRGCERSRKLAENRKRAVFKHGAAAIAVACCFKIFFKGSFVVVLVNVPLNYQVSQFKEGLVLRLDFEGCPARSPEGAPCEKKSLEMACMHYCTCIFIYSSMHLSIFIFMFTYDYNGCRNHTPYQNIFKQCQVARGSQQLTTNS